MEKNPWWTQLPVANAAALPTYAGPVGVNPAGGGSVRGCGRVGPMLLHRAVHNRDKSGARACFIYLFVCSGAPKLPLLPAAGTANLNIHTPPK